jgi:hypothetical protein
MTRLAKYGLLAFGTRQLQHLPGHNHALDFRVAVIYVVRADDPAIDPAN